MHKKGKAVYHMTMLQEQAVQMIQDMSDDNVGFLMRREQTLEEILYKTL